MLTDRGNLNAFKTFEASRLRNKQLLPLINNNKKELFNERKNSNESFLSKKNLKYFISSKQINTFKDIQDYEDGKNSITSQDQKFLDKKIIHLINCYKDLKFSPNTKKQKLREFSQKASNNKDNSSKNKLNILSKSLTKTYKISDQQDKDGVKKLDEWDKNNLAQIYGNSDAIYNSLYNFYSKKEDFEKIVELNYYKNIIKSNGEDVENIITLKNTNNKIIKDYLNLKIKEQSYILKNSLSKSHSKLNKTLLFVKEKKLAINLGIDNETLADLRKIDDRNFNNYEKVIKDKDKKEIMKKEELINILIKIFNKKLEKSKKEKIQSENFEKINQIILKCQSDILKIQFDIDSKKELYDKIHNTEYDKEHLVEKINLLQTIKYESDQEKKKQKLLRKDCDEQINELTRFKEEISEELDIIKNEIAYMKLVYINLVKSQRNYYLDLLKKGYDVRGEGLIWVVKRLLEIQTKLEYHHFPKFLDNNQIKYIIEMANISLEEIQLKTILKIVEKRRDDIQSSVNNRVLNKIEALSKVRNRHRKSVFTIEMDRMKANLLMYEDTATKIFESFQKIYRKYKSIFLNKIAQKDEDVKIQRIIHELKTSLIEGGGKATTDNFQQLTGILDYLNNNKESKEYLEIMLLVKFRLSYIHKLRENLREEQINNFQQEISNNKNNRFFNAELSLRLDLVKAALFGNKF